MKRLNKDEKASILLATRDAVFQQIADNEEDMTDCANEEAEAALERLYPERDINEFGPAIQKEIQAIFSRIYDAIKKGEDR